MPDDKYGNSVSRSAAKGENKNGKTQHENLVEASRLILEKE